MTYVNLHEATTSEERADNRLLGLGLGPELSLAAGPVDVFLRPFGRIVRNVREGRRGEGPEGTDWTAAVGAAGELRVHFGRPSLDLAGEVARLDELESARVSTFTGVSTEEGLGALSLELGLGMAPVGPRSRTHTQIAS